MASSALPSTFSSTDLKSHLQALLDEKEKQLQQAGHLGQRVLAQQMELEERIRQLSAYADSDDEADFLGKGRGEVKGKERQDRYQDLAQTLAAWDSENAQLSSAFSTEVCLLSVECSENSNIFLSLI